MHNDGEKNSNLLGNVREWIKKPIHSIESYSTIKEI